MYLYRSLAAAMVLTYKIEYGHTPTAILEYKVMGNIKLASPISHLPYSGKHSREKTLTKQQNNRSVEKLSRVALKLQKFMK
jgi:endo-alpha-1,4-polygalactosaminidase (GH114 family)